jgi:hypothetical protein
VLNGYSHALNGYIRALNGYLRLYLDMLRIIPEYNLDDERSIFTSWPKTALVGYILALIGYMFALIGYILVR